MMHPELYEGLSRLLGESIDYDGRQLRVIDVLGDGPSLVIEESSTEIQADLHGDPRRRVQRTLTVNALDDSGRHLNPLLFEMLSTRQLDELGAAIPDVSRR